MDHIVSELGISFPMLRSWLVIVGLNGGLSADRVAQDRHLLAFLGIIHSARKSGSNLAERLTINTDRLAQCGTKKNGPGVTSHGFIAQQRNYLDNGYTFHSLKIPSTTDYRA